MITTATPIAAEIGAATVEHIEIARARGKSAHEIAADLNLDIYTVEEAFAWHDFLAGVRGAA
jgi:hypothetical protein